MIYAISLLICLVMKLNHTFLQHNLQESSWWVPLMGVLLFSPLSVLLASVVYVGVALLG